MNNHSISQIIGAFIILTGVILGVVGIFSPGDRQGLWAVAAFLFLIGGLFTKK